MSDEAAIAERWREINQRVTAAARAAGRAPDAVRVIAVSKGHGPESVIEAARAGAIDFGENYLAELEAKATAVSQNADFKTPLTWHYQGTLQRRKIRDILRVVAVVQSVARVEELDEIEKRAVNEIPCLLEVNIGREPRKNGVLPEGVAALVAHVAGLAHVRLRGLMTVPPDDGDPARWFAALRELAAHQGLLELSMGMSSDFEIAIREGATMVRIGTALFGPRIKT